MENLRKGKCICNIQGDNYQEYYDNLVDNSDNNKLSWFLMEITPNNDTINYIDSENIEIPKNYLVKQIDNEYLVLYNSNIQHFLVYIVI